MRQGDEDQAETEGIGPEAGDDVIERDVIEPELFASCCPQCGRPLSCLDEGVVAWT